MRQLYPWQSLAHPKVEVIHGTGFDADEYLVLARLRVGNIFVAQDFRTTKFVNADGFHEGVLLLCVVGCVGNLQNQRHMYRSRGP